MKRTFETGRKEYIAITLFIFIFSACADLTQINTFSNVSVKTLTSYNNVNYSFTYSYYHYTAPVDIYFFGPKELETNKIRLPKLTVDSSKLRLANEADKVIVIYITGITIYFQGLNKLSDKELATYNFDDVCLDIKNNKELKKFLNIEVTNR